MEGERLDIALAKMLPDLSRSKLTACIKSGEALIFGKKFKPKDKVNGDEIVFLSINQNQNTLWSAEDIPINIIFEDADIIVINKEFGLVTHPGSGNWSGTLANALLNYDPNLEALDRAGIVHRLDKNTSGLMVVAKNHKSQRYLVEQLQTHSVSREYSAIVYGHMIAGGTINEPLGRDHKDRVKQAVTRNGKEAITHYRVIDRFQNHTHVKAILETGRTHQIRVHLAFIGFPILGDSVYGGRKKFAAGTSESLKKEISKFSRQALHAEKLEFAHPASGKLVNYSAEKPKDLINLIELLNKSL